MMILATFRLCALGALLTGTAVPSLAAAPQTPAAENAEPRGSQRADSGRSRRVELPFPLDVRAPDRAPPAPVPQESTGPHPFRETLLKRASLAEQPATRGRLSHQPDFS
jgi:hypothetical protein